MEKKDVVDYIKKANNKDELASLHPVIDARIKFLNKPLPIKAKSQILVSLGGMEQEHTVISIDGDIMYTEYKGQSMKVYRDKVLKLIK